MGVAAWLAANPMLYWWDKLSMQYIADITALCEKLSYDTIKFPFYMRIWGGLVIMIIIVGASLQVYILAGIIAFIVIIFPRQILFFLVKRRKQVLRDQLITSISVIRNSVKAGVTLEQAMASAANEIPAPLNREFRRIVGEYRHGRPFEETLEDAKRRLGLTGFVLFATTLITNKKHGGNISNTLEEIQKSLVENQRLERKLEADTATGRLVINVLAMFPLAFLLLSYFLNPEGTVLMFTTIFGQIVLVVATGLVYTGFKIGQKIVDIEF